MFWETLKEIMLFLIEAIAVSSPNFPCLFFSQALVSLCLIRFVKREMRGRIFHSAREGTNDIQLHALLGSNSFHPTWSTYLLLCRLKVSKVINVFLLMTKKVSQTDQTSSNHNSERKNTSMFNAIKSMECIFLVVWL